MSREMGKTQLRLRQLQGVMRMEIKKQLWDKRALPAYLLAGLMVLLAGFSASIYVGQNAPVRGDVTPYLQVVRPFLAKLYFWFFLKGTVFFGCLTIFLNLFRGELLDRSLHYYFLTPMRRETLVVGKFLSGILSTSLIFGGSILLSVALLYAPVLKAEGLGFLISGGDWTVLWQYVGITLLACLGYGAVFLLFGFFIRNSLVPSVLFCAWEWLSFLLPPVMQRFTVVHYCRSLLPLPVGQGPVAVLVDPTPFSWSGPCMILFACLAMALVCLRIRLMDIRYN